MVKFTSIYPSNKRTKNAEYNWVKRARRALGVPQMPGMLKSPLQLYEGFKAPTQ